MGLPQRINLDCNPISIRLRVRKDGDLPPRWQAHIINNPAPDLEHPRNGTLCLKTSSCDLLPLRSLLERGVLTGLTIRWCPCQYPFWAISVTFCREGNLLGNAGEIYSWLLRQLGSNYWNVEGYTNPVTDQRGNLFGHMNCFSLGNRCPIEKAPRGPESQLLWGEGTIWVDVNPNLCKKVSDEAPPAQQPDPMEEKVSELVGLAAQAIAQPTAAKPISEAPEAEEVSKPPPPDKPKKVRKPVAKAAETPKPEPAPVVIPVPQRQPPVERPKVIHITKPPKGGFSTIGAALEMQKA